MIGQEWSSEDEEVEEILDEIPASNEFLDNVSNLIDSLSHMSDVEVSTYRYIVSTYRYIVFWIQRQLCSQYSSETSARENWSRFQKAY